MALVLWHNPRCSKSRQALKLLEGAGQSPKLRMYLKEQPSEDELSSLLQKLGKAPSEVIRKGERTFKDLGLKDASEAELLAAMVAEPILIERPIAVHGDKAAIGRPPEDVLSVL